MPSVFARNLRLALWLRFPTSPYFSGIGEYFYTDSVKRNGGIVECVLDVKDVPDRLAKAVVADYERGLTAEIMKYPWQSETCIGEWHYARSLYEKPGQYGGYLDPRDIVHWLIDT